jgi:hypothetical protein
MTTSPKPSALTSRAAPTLMPISAGSVPELAISITTTRPGVVSGSVTGVGVLLPNTMKAT